MRNNKQKIEVGNDLVVSGNNNQLNKQNNIDKSTKLEINLNELPMGWVNPLNNDVIPYKRSPKINDRPLLEKYFKLYQIQDEYGFNDNITRRITFHAYVAHHRYKNVYVLSNLIGEFGEKLATHVIVKCDKLGKYLNNVIKFEGSIYHYNDENIEEDSKAELKYSVVISDDSIEVVFCKKSTILKTPWNNIPEDTVINIEELSNKFNKLDPDFKREMLYDIEDKLNQLSNNMFGVPNLIYPLILSKFLMRDDIYDENVIMYNIRHLNIITTIITDYIIELKPKTFLELLQIVTYYTLTYLGLDFEKPNDHSKVREFATNMGISESGFKESVRNSNNNAGGISKILETIPKTHRIKPGPNPRRSTFYRNSSICKKSVLSYRMRNIRRTPYIFLYVP